MVFLMHVVCHDDVVAYYEWVMVLVVGGEVIFGTKWRRWVGHNVAGGRKWGTTLSRDVLITRKVAWVVACGAYHESH